MGNSIPHHHEDHIAGKGENSLQHYNLVHKFIPMPQAMKKSRSESSGGQGMGKIGENFGVEFDESQKLRKQSSMKQGCRALTSSFCIINGHLSSEKC